MNNSETGIVLIIDDSIFNIEVLSDALEEKYEVIFATTGSQGLKLATERKPDLILLDIMMPEMSGFEVCTELKKQERTKDISIIFISVATDHEYELQGLQLGAIDYIHKPFSIPLIQARVAAHIELAKSRQELALKNYALESAAKLRDDIDRITRHDLKTPLNAIIGFPQLLLLDDNLLAEQKDLLEHVIRAGNDMLGMINVSLDLFKMETGRYHCVTDAVDIVALLKNIANDLKNFVFEKQLEIEIFIDGKKTADTEFLIQAEKILSYSLFGNLLKNAIEASGMNNKIQINLHYDTDMGVITITNCGSVPESIRDRFFDKYVTAGKPLGTGLGTYSAKLMTQVQQGHIEMATDSEKTIITVCLPRV